MNRAMMTAALAVMVAAAPAGAQAQCWIGADIDAAKVRDLQAGLMVASQRCQGSGFGTMAGYEAFVGANSRAIAAINQRLKARFVTASGAEEGMRQLDRFTGALAMAYGGQEISAETCAGMAALAREAAESGGSVTGLLRIADRLQVAPSLPGGACSVVFATR